MNEKVDWGILEVTGREVGVWANLHHLGGTFTAQDTWTNLVEEKACCHDEQLVTLGSSRDRLDNHQNTIDKQVMKVEYQSMEDVIQSQRIQAHQDTQQASLNTMRWDIEEFQTIVTVQSGLVHLQMEVVQGGMTSCWRGLLSWRWR